MPHDPSISILVVDHFGAMSRIVRPLLEQLGFVNIEEVYDGDAALERLHERSFSLVIADWRVSPLGGLNLLHRLRRHETLRDTKFILTSSAPHPHLPEVARSLKADGLLVKPYSIDSLRETVEHAFV